MNREHTHTHCANASAWAADREAHSVHRDANEDKKVFSSGVIRAVGMAATPATTTTPPNGTQELRLTLEPQHTNITRIKKFATVDGRKFATATTCLACVGHAANNANATVDSKPLAPKYNVGIRSLQSALRNLRVSRDPPP